VKERHSGKSGNTWKYLEIPGNISRMSMYVISQATTLSLSPEQTRVVEGVLNLQQQKLRKAVFITGFAGSGKTVVTKSIIEGFVGLYGTEGVIVTGMTGVAATHYETGRTLHSVFGLGKGDSSVDECLNKISDNKSMIAVIQKAKVLIIDEISFIDKALLDKIKRILIIIRERRSAIDKDGDIGFEEFGGIFLIMVGDWMQLVPYALEDRTRLPFYRYFVGDETITTPERLAELEKAARISGRDEDKVQKKFIWARYDFYMLKDIKRQGGDLQKFMKDIRYGWMKLKPQSFEMLRKLIEEKQWPVGLDPVKLYCTREEVNSVNREKLMHLLDRNRSDGIDHQIRVYNATDTFSVDCYDAATHATGEDLVRELTNLVTELECAIGQPVICLKNSFRDQLVNGSQGIVIGFADATKAKSDTLKVFGSFPDSDTEYPVVRFLARDTLPERVVVMAVSSVMLESSPGVVYFSRSQVPIMPAWALTVHKAQGMSIDYLVIDISKLFCPNQLYAAITRATKWEFTQLLGLSGTQIQLLEDYRLNKAIDVTDKKLLLKAIRKFMHLIDAQSAYNDHWDPYPCGQAYKSRFPGRVRDYKRGLKDKTQRGKTLIKRE
jgi:ATP-dependent DNA helicase PIF1